MCPLLSLQDVACDVEPGCRLVIEEEARELALRGDEARVLGGRRRREHRDVARSGEETEAIDLGEDGLRIVERVVALEEEGRARPRGEGEDLLGDGMRVRVVVVAVLERAAGDVDERDAVEREVVEARRLAVLRVRMEVRDVEEQRAARRPGDLVEEGRLGHLVIAPDEGAGRVLEEERYVGEPAADRGHVAREHGDRAARARELGEVADLAATRPDERHVLRDEPRVEIAREAGEPVDARVVHALRAARRDPDAVEHHRPHPRERDDLPPDRGVPAGLGDDLEEVDAAGPAHERSGKLRSVPDPGARHHEQSL